jgi:hypothetical protein
MTSDDTAPRPQDFTSAKDFIAVSERFHDSRLPSNHELLTRAARLANDNLTAIDLQIRRIRNPDETDDNWPFIVWLDFQFLVISLARIRRAANIAKAVHAVHDCVQDALTDFDREVPDVLTMRNVAEHIDEYSQDLPTRRQRRADGVKLIGRRSLEVGSWSSDHFTWLGFTIKFDDALAAAVKLYCAIKESRTRLDSQSEAGDCPKAGDDDSEPDSNATGSTHPESHRFKYCAAGRGRCRTTKDRLGVKWSAISRLCSNRVATTPHDSRDAHPRPEHRSSWTTLRTRPAEALGARGVPHGSSSALLISCGRPRPVHLMILTCAPHVPVPTVMRGQQRSLVSSFAVYPQASIRAGQGLDRRSIFQAGHAGSTLIFTLPRSTNFRFFDQTPAGAWRFASGYSLDQPLVEQKALAAVRSDRFVSL